MATPKVPPVSPFPQACVARIFEPPADKLGATLVARQLGYLAVKVTFHKQPCYDLEVKLYEAEADGTKGAQVGDGKTFKTDRAGMVMLDTLVDRGLYVAEIENQTTLALVTTVEDPSKPYVVPLPVDRPYFDFDEACEWDDERREVVDYVSQGQGAAEGVEDDEPGMMTVAIAAGSDGSFDDYPRYLLEATDGSYSRDVSAREAAVDRAGYKQIVFRNLVPDVSYRLTRIVDPDHRIVVFDGEPYDAVIDQEHDAGGALADHKMIAFDVGGPADVQWGSGS
jgi:hypothetical protein